MITQDWIAQQSAALDAVLTAISAASQGLQTGITLEACNRAIQRIEEARNLVDAIPSEED